MGYRPFEVDLCGRIALTLLARLHGPEIAMGLQLGIEYDPQPLRVRHPCRVAAPPRHRRARGQPADAGLSHSGAGYDDGGGERWLLPVRNLDPS